MALAEELGMRPLAPTLRSVARVADACNPVDYSTIESIRCGGRAPSGADGPQQTVTRTSIIQQVTLGSAYAARSGPTPARN
jgi:hypothetical protein